MRNNLSVLVVKNIVAAGVVKLSSIALSILIVPAYINYFDSSETLGLWFTLVVSVTTLISLDLGIGNSLRDSLVAAFENKDYNKASINLKTAYFTSVVLGLLFLSFACVFVYSDWFDKSVRILDPSVFDHRSIRDTILIFAFCLFLQQPLRLSNSIFYARQRAALANLSPLLAQLVLYIYVRSDVVIFLDDKLLSIAVVYLISFSLPLVIINLIVLKNLHWLPEYNLSLNQLIQTSKGLLSKGGAYSLLQIFFILFVGTNEIIITRYFELKDVTDYQFYNRLFSLATAGYALLTIPIWSAVTKALIENNIVWIRRSFNLLVASAIFISLFIGLLNPFYQILFDTWLGKNVVTIEHNTVWNFVGYNLAIMLFMGSSAILNGMGFLRAQIIVYFVIVVLKFVLIVGFNDDVFDWNSVVQLNAYLSLPAAVVLLFYVYFKIHYIKRIENGV